jgi:hypothetical protein
MIAATVTKTYSPFADRWLVTLDADAAEIMGETRMEYRFNMLEGALKFAETLQANLDAAWKDAA